MPFLVSRSHYHWRTLTVNYLSELSQVCILMKSSDEFYWLNICSGFWKRTNQMILVKEYSYKKTPNCFKALFTFVCCLLIWKAKIFGIKKWCSAMIKTLNSQHWTLKYLDTWWKQYNYSWTESGIRAVITSCQRKGNDCYIVLEHIEKCVIKCKKLKSTDYDNVSTEVYFHILISFSFI